MSGPDRKNLVLVVDDIEINRMMLRQILLDEYDIIEACDGPTTLDLLFRQGLRPDAILLDIVMPGMDGLEVLRYIKRNLCTQTIPVLFITATESTETEALGFQTGAADYISKPFAPEIVRARLRSHIKLSEYQNDLERQVRIKTEEVTKTYEHTLEVLATIIEYRDLESGAHIRRTTILTQLLVDRMRAMPRYQDYFSTRSHVTLVKATALHDIGKIGVGDHILLKPGRLNPQEYDIMKGHTVLGKTIIDSIAKELPDTNRYLELCREICATHHEWWDGRGYPNGLKGEEIPLSGRILSIVDVYDALVNDRCYKSALPHGRAVQLIEEGRGTQFDPDLVEVFLASSGDFESVSAAMRD